MSAAATLLYTPDILALAVSLIEWPLRAELPYRAELRSPSCGSVVRIGLDVTAAGQVTRIGLDARACALGQASAAVLAAHICGQDRAALLAARNAITGFFAGEPNEVGDWLDDWPGAEHLTRALPYPGRHGSILLPWRAAVAALDAPAGSTL